MAIISIFSGAYLPDEAIADEVTSSLGYKRHDQSLLQEVAQRRNVSVENLKRAMEGPPFVFNKFTHKREHLLAFLRLALAEAVEEDELLFCGFLSLLLPKRIGHILRVCLVADVPSRVERLVHEGSLSAKDAQRRIEEEDGLRHQWAQELFGTSAWDKSLYDLKIPLQDSSVEEATALIVKQARNTALQRSTQAVEAIRDFQLAARANLALVQAGHFYFLSCQEGVVTITIDRYVLRLEHLEKELKKIVAPLDGVQEVLVKTGPNYRPTSVFAGGQFDMPERVLLVDDERDFVMTLSERLEMRNMEPAIAHNGQEALDILQDEEPEVMVLDLKMPGIDGIEVLKKVKAEHPQIEVIILTGHGSEKDRDLCMELGAFAYLEKPVDIKELSKEMKTAYEKIQQNKTTPPEKDE
jgi:two-component system, OmpR family, response regulator CpxR